MSAACDFSKPSGFCRIESDRPLSIEEMRGHARRQSVEVEKVSSAITLSGMRYSPEQQPGEIAINRWITGGGYEPLWPNGNHPYNTYILSHNSNWATLGSSNATWISGGAMNDQIKQASFWVIPGKCVGFKPFEHENYVTLYSFLGNTVCRGPGDSLENWYLWNQNWNISAMKTAYINYNGQWPPGFL
jgi:hypothetical protein